MSSSFFLQGKAPKEIHVILTETLACFLPVRLRTYQHPCNILSTCKVPKEIHAILTETLACFIPGPAKDLSAPLQYTQHMQGAEGNSRHSDRNISLFPSWAG